MLLVPLLAAVGSLVATTALGATPVSPTGSDAPPGPPTATRDTAVPAPRAGWSWPLAGSPTVVHPFLAPPGPYAAGHRGVDLAGAVGADVLAPAAGVVTLSGAVAGVPVVVVGHAGGLRSTLQPVLGSVPVGTRVGPGEVVGTLTGGPGHCSPDACLHWGVLRGATYLDPTALLRPQRVVLLPWS